MAPPDFQLTLGHTPAGFKTAHVANGQSAVVNWQLNVSCASIGPTLFFGSHILVDIRPVVVSGCKLGMLSDGKLTVSPDRPGFLEVTATALGYQGLVGINFPLQQRASLTVETGYRLLNFTNVSLQPKDGFTVSATGPLVRPGNLPESLDYSGFLLRAGIRWYP